MHVVIVGPNQFFGESVKKRIFAVAFYDGLDDRKGSGRVTTSGVHQRQLVDFGPVTPEFIKLVCVLKSQNCQYSGVNLIGLKPGP